MVQPRFAPTVTTGITPTLARPTDSMAQIIFWAAFLSAPGHGSMVSAATASLIAGSVVIVDSVATVVSAVIVDSAAIAVSAAMARSAAVASSTAVTDFTAAAEVEDSMAAVAVHMVAVASMEVAEVTAVPSLIAASLTEYERLAARAASRFHFGRGNLALRRAHEF